jgi:hypothetical protein
MLGVNCNVSLNRVCGNQDDPAILTHGGIVPDSLVREERVSDGAAQDFCDPLALNNLSGISGSVFI